MPAPWAHTPVILSSGAIPAGRFTSLSPQEQHRVCGCAATDATAWDDAVVEPVSEPFDRIAAVNSIGLLAGSSPSPWSVLQPLLLPPNTNTTHPGYTPLHHRHRPRP